MKADWAWIQRRFWDFRFGHSTYLGFALSFINFIVINYHLLISNIPFLTSIFTQLWMFAVTFLIAYPILSISIGYFIHRQRQLHTDIEIATLENPYLWKAQPGREIRLSLPLLRDTVKMNMELWRKFGLLTQEKESHFNEYLAMLEGLINGKTLQEAIFTRELTVTIEQ